MPGPLSREEFAARRRAIDKFGYYPNRDDVLCLAATVEAAWEALDAARAELESLRALLEHPVRPTSAVPLTGPARGVTGSPLPSPPVTGADLSTVEAYRTRTGRVLTEADLDALVAEAERGYAVEHLTGSQRAFDGARDGWRECAHCTAEKRPCWVHAPLHRDGP